MKGFTRMETRFSLCGLNCDLCSMHLGGYCPGCGGVVKPDVVLYEEMLDRNTIEDAIDEISRADMLIIGGTSLVVYPAAGYVDYFQGDSLVMINRDETPRDSRCSLVFRESVGKVLEAGVAALKK